VKCEKNNAKTPKLKWLRTALFYPKKELKCENACAKPEMKCEKVLFGTKLHQIVQKKAVFIPKINHTKLPISGSIKPKNAVKLNNFTAFSNNNKFRTFTQVSENKKATKYR
jgi:hypothetical protein